MGRLHKSYLTQNMHLTNKSFELNYYLNIYTPSNVIKFILTHPALWFFGFAMKSLVFDWFLI